MHGIVHKTLKEYVVAKTDDETWDSIVERSALEPTLYLPVSHYDDADVDAVLETLSTMADRDRRAIERDFGRSLAPELLSTFNAHVRGTETLRELLESVEPLTEDIEAAAAETSVPAVSSTADADGVTVTYDTHRERPYCGLAHGILEGLSDAFDADATVTEDDCVADGADACTFRIALE